MRYLDFWKRIVCTVKPYHILNEGFRTFCRKASLSFPGEWTWGCGITFDIFTHVLHGSLFKFIKIYTDIKIKKIHCNDLDEGYNAHIYKKIHGWNKLQIDDLDDGYKKHCIQVI